MGVRFSIFSTCALHIFRLQLFSTALTTWCSEKWTSKMQFWPVGKVYSFFFFLFFNLCSNFKHGHKDYIFILLHKGSEQVLMLTEHFKWYLATKKETLSAQNSQEHQLAKFMARCGKITSTLSTFADFSLCWHFWCPESCCAHILCCWCQRTLSVFTCQDEENLLQCPKDLTPVKYIHLTQALWSRLWNLKVMAWSKKEGKNRQWL